MIFSARRKDFRVDTFKSGGKGGQHQNKTDSGVRITHIETKLFAESRSNRSQHQNRKIAFRRLAQKLVKHVLDKEARAKIISNEIIRSYNEPDNRVKDHESKYQQSFDEVMDDIGPMIEARRHRLMERITLS